MLKVDFRKLEREIPFREFVENTSYQERSIGNAILWLEENGWLSVRRNGGRANIYGVAMQLLEDANCLVDLPSDSGKSQSAKIADENSSPPKPPYKDLRSLKENTHSTPVLDTTSNRAEPEPEEGYPGYFFSQPEIPDHPVAQKLKYCGLYPRNVLKLMSEYEPEYIWAVTRNFEQDMRERHNVRDFAGTLVWRIRNGITSWDADSWVSDVQREFNESVKSDRSRLLGVVEFAALEQKTEVQEVMSKLDLEGITHQDMQQWAQIEMGIDP